MAWPACFQNRDGVSAVVVVSDLASLRQKLAADLTKIVLIDVTQGIDLFDLRTVAMTGQDVSLVALGLTEQKQDVIKCGRAGFAGYGRPRGYYRRAFNALSNIGEGRLACPPEISGGLLRALFRKGPETAQSLSDPMLTKRESEDAGVIGRGLSNKEIGTELSVSVATVNIMSTGCWRSWAVQARGSDAPGTGCAMVGADRGGGNEKKRLKEVFLRT